MTRNIIEIALAVLLLLPMIVSGQSIQGTLPETIAYSVFNNAGLYAAGVPCQTAQSMTLQSLCNLSGSHMAVYTTATATNPFWRSITFLPGVSKDIPINSSMGYILASRNSQQGQMVLTGTPWPETSLTTKLHPGCNLIAFPRGVPTDYRASDFCRLVDRVTIARLIVDRTTGRGRWVAYVPGITGTDFDIEHGKGYLVVSHSWQTVTLPQRSRALSKGTGFAVCVEEQSGVHIQLVSRDGSTATTVGPFSPLDTNPRFDPTGSVIAFSSVAFCGDGAPEDPMGIFLTNAIGDGNNLVRLTGVSASGCDTIRDQAPNFSRDGKIIFAFAGSTFGGPQGIGGMPRDAKVDLRSKFVDNNPQSWATPSNMDDKTLFFISSRPEGDRVCKSSVVESFKPSSPVTMISPTPVTAPGLAVGPDDSVYFTSGRDVIRHFPDGHEVNLTNCPPGHSARSADITQDGSTLTFVRDDTQLWEMSWDGSDQLLVREFNRRVRSASWRP